jgi:hypothetical protein
MGDFLFDLLQLPSDLLTYLVREHLAPAPAVALSLTCKDSFKLLRPLLEASRQLPFSDPRTKAEFCELLEKDVSDKYYFCPICPSLHPFTPADGPKSSDYAADPDTPDCRRCRWTLGESGFTMGLHHVRLALNRHLFGPTSGISLDQFSLRYFTDTSPAFHERWSAKILDGDLFLASTRTVSWDMPYIEFLDRLWVDRYKLCEHNLLYDIPTMRRGTGFSIEEFHDVLGHCRRCFTDWTITAKLTDARWQLTVNTYHRFPSNRAQSAVATDSRFVYDTEVIPMYRDAGLVRDIWLGRASKTARAGRWMTSRVFGPFGDIHLLSGTRT